MKSLGMIFSILIMFFMLLTQGSSMFANVWLSQWTDDPFLKNQSNAGDAAYTEKNDLYLGVYGAMGFVQGNV